MHGEGRLVESVCISPTAPEVKHCLSRSVSHSRGPLQLSSFSRKSLISASSHPLPSYPIPWQGLQCTTLSPLLAICGHKTRKAEGRRLKNVNVVTGRSRENLGGTKCTTQQQQTDINVTVQEPLDKNNCTGRTFSFPFFLISASLGAIPHKEKVFPLRFLKSCSPSWTGLHLPLTVNYISFKCILAKALMQPTYREKQEDLDTSSGQFPGLSQNLALSTVLIPSLDTVLGMTFLIL